MSPSDHEIIVDWKVDLGWNELCANIVEVFGLPGDRFISTPTEDFMVFTFKNVKDAQLCKLLLSEHL